MRNRQNGIPNGTEEFDLSGNETSSEAGEPMADESKRKAPLQSESEDGQDTEERRTKQSRISNPLSPDRRVPTTPNAQAGGNAGPSGTNIPISQTAPLSQQRDLAAAEMVNAMDPRAAAHMALHEQMQRMFAGSQDLNQDMALNIWGAENGDEQTAGN